jgi:hypothetical protein
VHRSSRDNADFYGGFGAIPGYRDQAPTSTLKSYDWLPNAVGRHKIALGKLMSVRIAEAVDTGIQSAYSL